MQILSIDHRKNTNFANEPQEKHENCASITKKTQIQSKDHKKNRRIVKKKKVNVQLVSNNHGKTQLSSKNRGKKLEYHQRTTKK